MKRGVFLQASVCFVPFDPSRAVSAVFLSYSGVLACLENMVSSLLLEPIQTLEWER